MLRRLLIYRSDLREMSWFRRGQPAPMPSSDERVEMRWVDEAAWLDNPAILPTASPVVRQRYVAHGRCLVGIDRISGKTVYHLWLSTGSAYIDWIFRTLTAPGDGVLIFDVWVDPSLRGSAVHRLGTARHRGWCGGTRIPLFCHPVRTHGAWNLPASLCAGGITIGLKILVSLARVAACPPAGIRGAAEKPISGTLA